MKQATSTIRSQIWPPLLKARVAVTQHRQIVFVVVL